MEPFRSYEHLVIVRLGDEHNSLLAIDLRCAVPAHLSIRLPFSVAGVAGVQQYQNVFLQYGGGIEGGKY